MNILKKLLPCIVAVAAVLICLFTLPTEAQAATEGYYTYTISNEEVTITDCDMSISGAVTIPSTLGGYPVTSIGDYAFEDCTGLTSVTIGNGVAIIGKSAFESCGLKSITLPDSVTNIGGSAFKGCSRLTSITIPDGVTSIKGHTFEMCSRLTNVKIPDSVVSIYDSAFYMCISLKSITIPNSVTIIGQSAFERCGLKSITLPDSVTNIDLRAFRDCDKLTNVTIPDSVINIGYEAFYNCTGLTGLIIPNSVTYIDSRAFLGCHGLTSITIPDSVTSVGTNAFSDCSIKQLIIADGSKTVNRTMVVCGSTLNEVVISDSVTSIDGSAFYNCTGLTKITLPKNIDTIEKNAFSNCSQLKTVNFKGTEENWDGIMIKSGNNCLDNAKIIYNYTDHKHSWDNGKVTKAATCKEAGIRTYTCTGCKDITTEEIAVLTAHTYDNNCDAECNVCNATRTVSHQYKNTWSKGKSGHWHECSVCKDKKDLAAHTPGAAATETTAQTCTTCGYVIKAALGHSHSFATEWTKDKNGHWHACSGCGEKADESAHAPGAAATETTPQTCTVCGYEIAPALGGQETQPSDATEPTDPSPTDPVGGDDEDGEMPIGIFFVGVLLGGGVAGAIVVVFLKKKR